MHHLPRRLQALGIISYSSLLLLSLLSTEREEANYLFIIWWRRLNIKRGQMTLNYLSKPLRASSIMNAALKVKVELYSPGGWCMALEKARRDTRHTAICPGEKLLAMQTTTRVRISKSARVWISQFTSKNWFGFITNLRKPEIIIR